MPDSRVGEKGVAEGHDDSRVGEKGVAEGHDDSGGDPVGFDG